MADIKQITIGETTYNLKDADARDRIAALESYTDYLGVTTTALTDGASTNPVVINGESVTAVTGNIVNYGSKEFIFNGTVWQEFGDLSALGDLAYEDTAEGSYTPVGTVSQPTASASTTPATVNSITDVGTLPSMTVANEVLTFSPGTLPTKGTDTTVVASVDSVTVTQPTFTGTAATITVSAPTPTP
jgi:hypothetical protein